MRRCWNGASLIQRNVYAGLEQCQIRLVDLAQTLIVAIVVDDLDYAEEVRQALKLLVKMVVDKICMIRADWAENKRVGFCWSVRCDSAVPSNEAFICMDMFP